ncbi:trans-sulfuration enzyme family member [Holotrichia oblita]|nr:trans-sulfuration enzyme family member [Holotrichia oblita]
MSNKEFLHSFNGRVSMKIETACIHGAKDEMNLTGAVAVPIYQSSTFAHKAVGQSTGYDYSRLQNPTREHLEKTVAALESGTDALAFSTGMAAISALMELFKPGDRIIASDDLYGGSIRLFDTISKKNGLIIDYANTSDTSSLNMNICDDTKAIFIESPSNPMMRVTDIAAVKSLIKDKDIILIVDNTFLTPYFQQPLLLGADIVMHSGTKYLGGHNDTLAGFLITSSPKLSERLRFIHKTTGACLSPFDSFLISRGIKTLAVRMEKGQQNAMAVAEWLLKHEKVTAVHYVGLAAHPDYEISKKQSCGFGSMISFEVDCEKTAYNILEKVKLIMFAESLGGVETLITYPMLQTHADVPKQDREKRGINERLLRISVGIENVEDIINDLTQALE